MNKTILLSFLTLLLTLFLTLLLTTKLSSQEIHRSQQIAVSTNSGFYGDIITGKCSTRRLEPGVSLSLQWYAREGPGENATLVSLGGCEAIEPSFPALSCNASVTTTDLYINGGPDYAVGSISYKTNEAVTALVCILGNDQSLEQPLDLRGSPRIENIQILCQNCQAILSWEVQGSVDSYRVNVGDNNWHETHQSFIAYPLTSHLVSRAIKIQGVSDRFGRGPMSSFVITRQRLVNRGVNFASESCTKVRVDFEIRNLKPVICTPSLGNYDFPATTLPESGQLIVDLQSVPPIYDTSNVLSFTLKWGCRLSDEENNDECRQEVPTLVREFIWDERFKNALHYGPEKLTLGCLHEEMAGNFLLDHSSLENAVLEAHWDHKLHTRLIFTNATRNYIYRIGVVDNQGFPVNFTLPIDTSGYIYDPLNDHLNNVLPQSQTTSLTLQRGHTYQVTITPDYIGSDIPESLCESQSLSHEIIIPALTEVIQINETSAGIQCMGNGSDCHIRVFINDESFAEFSNEQNVVMTALSINQTYTFVINYNGTNVVPCRTDRVTFTLSPTPSSVIMTSVASYYSDTSGSMVSSSNRPDTSITRISPTLTPSPDHENPTIFGKKDTYVPLYVAAGVWGVVLVVSVSFIVSCIYLRSTTQ